MFKLSTFRKRAKGYTDYTPYGLFIDEGVILNKSGSFTAAFSYRGEDLDSSTDEELNLLKRHFNNALMKFESNWLLNFDLVKSQKNSYPPVEQCKFPEPTSFVCDEERRGRYNQANLHFTNTHFIFLTYLPPNDAEATFADTFIVGKRETTSNYSRHLLFFQYALSVLESDIGAKLRLQRLTTDDIYSYLYTSITGELKRLKLYHPAIDLDYALGNFADVITDLKLKINNKYCRILTLVDFPENARPAVLHALTLLRFEFSWRTRYIILSTEDGDRLLRQRFKTWYGKRNTAKQIAAQAAAAANSKPVENNPESIGNMDAEVHAMAVKKAILDNALGKEKQGFCTSVIVVFDEDLESLDKKVKEINQVLSDKFFHAHEETVGAPMAYLGSLPAVDYFNVRMPALSTRYLADLIALDSVWPGLDKNPNPLLPENGINNPPLIQCVTSGGQPFSWSFHYERNGNALVIGPTGGDVLLNLAALQALKYDMAKVFFFDNQKTSMNVTYGVGGNFYDIGNPKNDVFFQPLRDLETSQQFQLARTFIRLLCEIKIPNLQTLSSQEDTDIGDVLTILKGKPLTQRTLTNFANLMQPKQRIIAEAVGYFSTKGPFGKLFDADDVTDDFTSVTMASFELEYINVQYGDEALVPLLVYIFNKLKIELFPKRLPIYIMIKDVWKALAKPKFASYLEDILRTGANSNVALILATGQPIDIIENPLAQVLLTQCVTKIFLPNSEAATPLGRTIYIKLGLNEKQISIIGNSKARKQFYYMSPYGKRLFELDICDFTKCFVDAHNPVQVQECYQKDKKLFAYNWVIQLANKYNNENLRKWAKYWMVIYHQYNRNHVEFNDGSY